MADWIDTFMSYTEDISSPEIFRRWCAIAAVAASMERRCWTQTKQGTLYPNLFTMLISSPGIGKTEAIKRAEELLQQTKKLVVSPQSLTKAALVDSIRDTQQSMINNQGAPIEYHSMTLCIDELGTMIAAHDLEFLSFLNKLYDSPVELKERRRHFHGGKDIVMARPQINMLAGSQPAFIAHLLPEEAWGMGFTSRMLLIYAGSGPAHADIFGSQVDHGKEQATLVYKLSQYAEKIGMFTWTPEAQRLLNEWNRARCPPIPDHSKLVNYITRRLIHVIKLCMVSALSRSDRLEVAEEDFIRARDWLIEAESFMPDIFREMAGKSDTDVIMELHYFMWQTMTSKRNRKQEGNVSEGELYNFLRLRVPSEKIQRILEVAERSRIIARDHKNPAFWIARPKGQHGVE